MVIYYSISCILFVCVVPHQYMFTGPCIWSYLVHFGGVKSDGTSFFFAMEWFGYCVSHVLFAMVGVVLWRLLTRGHLLLSCGRNLYHPMWNAKSVISCACHEFVASMLSDWITLIGCSPLLWMMVINVS